jgi:hypothetical protein
MYSEGGFELHWVDASPPPSDGRRRFLLEGSITMAMVGNTDGYVALGMSSDGAMIGSHAIIGSVGASSGTASASWYALGGKRDSDVKEAPEYTLTLREGSVVDGRTTIKFIVDKATSPSTFDPSSPTKYIFSLGSDNQIKQHSSRGLFELNLETGDSSSLSVPFSVYRWHLYHGLLMLLAWGVLLPIGAFVARFFKGPLSAGTPAHWFVVHRAVQIGGLTVALAGFYICLTRKEFGNVDTTHGSFGIAVMTLGILQPTNAFLRPHKGSRGRREWEWLHKSVGYGALALAVVTIFLGINRLHTIAGWSTSYLEVGYILFLVLILLALVYYSVPPPTKD